jgi:hypothetical protein
MADRAMRRDLFFLVEFNDDEAIRPSVIVFLEPKQYCKTDGLDEET